MSKRDDEFANMDDIVGNMMRDLNMNATSPPSKNLQGHQEPPKSSSALKPRRPLFFSQIQKNLKNLAHDTTGEWGGKEMVKSSKSVWGPLPPSLGSAAAARAGNDREAESFSSYFTDGNIYDWSLTAYAAEDGGRLEMPPPMPGPRFAKRDYASRAAGKRFSLDTDEDDRLDDRFDEEVVVWDPAKAWNAFDDSRLAASEGGSPLLGSFTSPSVFNRSSSINSASSSPVTSGYRKPQHGSSMDSPQTSCSTSSPSTPTMSSGLVRRQEAKAKKMMQLLPSAPIAPIVPNANANRETVVVGMGPMLDHPLKMIQNRLQHMKTVCNFGYGVVPMANTFTFKDSATTEMSSFESDEYTKQIDEAIYKIAMMSDLALFVQKKSSAKNGSPPTPRLPSKEEAARAGGICLYQIGYPNGRQALFQGLRTTANGQFLDDLIGTFVVMTADDGFDVALMRGVETLQGLVPRLQEVPFMRVIRPATKPEVMGFDIKGRKEAYMLQIVQKIVNSTPALSANMHVRHVEFQYDRNKLILFADMKQWVLFNDFVKLVHGKCESVFGYQLRVFIQRRFVKDL